MPDQTPDIDAIRQREQAATEGPWRAAWPNGLHPWEVCISADVPLVELAHGEQGIADAEFIAHAREDIPALLAERDQLRYERHLLGAARRILDRVGKLPHDAAWRYEAADLAQRIVDEIGHPVTDEPALGPELRAELARVTAERDCLTAELAQARAAKLQAYSKGAEDALASVTAKDLAIARQTLAHSGTGYVPPWHGLTSHEQQTSTIEAGHWLAALRNTLDSATAPVPGSSRRTQEPTDEDLVARVAQAMRDAHTPAAWAKAQGRPIPGVLRVPFEAYARAAVAELSGSSRPAQEPAAVDLSDLYSALDSAHTVMALSSQDWGAAGDFAWLYGIFVGWDNDPTGGDVDQDGGTLDELAARFRWDTDKVALLRRLRAAVAAFDINAVGDLQGAAKPPAGESQASEPTDDEVAVEIDSAEEAAEAEAQAHAQGYAEAVARLRDDERYRTWWTARPGAPGSYPVYWDGPGRTHLADYLETVGPDGIDMETGRWPAREHAVIRAAIAWRRLWTTTVLAAPAVRDLIEAVDALPHTGETKPAGESQASEPAERLATTEPYTMEARLCDDAGMVSDERVAPGAPGTTLDPDLTYRKLLNNLRGHTGLPPYEGPLFQCTGSAHLAREHIRCTSPAHTAPKLAQGGIIRHDQAVIVGERPIDLDDQPVHTMREVASVAPGHHVGRAWSGHVIEDHCPCPQEPCGLVDPIRAVPECEHHPVTRGKSIRQSHRAHQCYAGEPAAPKLAQGGRHNGCGPDCSEGGTFHTFRAGCELEPQDGRR